MYKAPPTANLKLKQSTSQHATPERLRSPQQHARQCPTHRTDAQARCAACNRCCCAPPCCDQPFGRYRPPEMFPYRPSASAMAIHSPRMCATWYVSAMSAEAFVQMRAGTRLGARMYDIVLRSLSVQRRDMCMFVSIVVCVLRVSFACVVGCSKNELVSVQGERSHTAQGRSTACRQGRDTANVCNQTM